MNESVYKEQLSIYDILVMNRLVQNLLKQVKIDPDFSGIIIRECQTN